MINLIDFIVNFLKFEKSFDVGEILESASVAFPFSLFDFCYSKLSLLFNLNFYYFTYSLKAVS